MVVTQTSSDLGTSVCGSPKMFLSLLPTCRVSTRLVGIESTGWRLFTAGSFKRNPYGTDAAGWGTAAASPENTPILCGPVICDPRHLAFSGATTSSNNTAELTGLAEAIWWANFSSLVVDVCVSEHAARAALGVAHA